MGPNGILIAWLDAVVDDAPSVDRVAVIVFELTRTQIAQVSLPLEGLEACGIEGVNHAWVCDLDGYLGGPLGMRVSYLGEPPEVRKVLWLSCAKKRTVFFREAPNAAGYSHADVRDLVAASDVQFLADRIGYIRARGDVGLLADRMRSIRFDVMTHPAFLVINGDLVTEVRALLGSDIGLDLFPSGHLLRSALALRSILSRRSRRRAEGYGRGEVVALLPEDDGLDAIVGLVEAYILVALGVEPGAAAGGGSGDLVSNSKAVADWLMRFASGELALESECLGCSSAGVRVVSLNCEPDSWNFFLLIELLSVFSEVGSESSRDFWRELYCRSIPALEVFVLRYLSPGSDRVALAFGPSGRAKSAPLTPSKLLDVSWRYIKFKGEDLNAWALRMKAAHAFLVWSSIRDENLGQTG